MVVAGMMWVFIALCAATLASEAWAKPVLMVSGRWDNEMIFIDLAKAIDPANDGTDKAVISRVRYTPDTSAGGPMGGQGINVVIPPGSPFAYVVDHGRMTAEESKAFQEGKLIQHGYPSFLVVFDIKRALDPANGGTLKAVEAFVETGGYGAAGLAVTPDGKYALVGHAESQGSEDGGNLLTMIDLKTRQVVRRLNLRMGSPGFPCPPNPIPHMAPDPKWGCFPDSNGMVLSPVGGGYLFIGNGGTDDVSVVDVQRALAGDPQAETHRIPVQTGPFGMGVSPDGKYVASANRESQRTGDEGNTISIIDVQKAIAKAKDAEVARILVGTNDPAVKSRPFAPAFIHGGKRILVTNFRTNNLSVVDVEKAITGEPAEVARIPLITPKQDPSRPRGIAITKDGRYAAITGAPPKKGRGSSVVFILDLDTLKVVGRVTGVGDEAYFLDVVPDDQL
jgi:DNA-binding beta-propeller fold protein YncE